MKLKPEDLDKIAQKMRAATNLREGAGDARVTVHLGTCGIASGAHARKAGKAAADALQAEQYKRIAQEASQDLLQSLGNAAELEKRMAARISALVESETKSVVMK